AVANEDDLDLRAERQQRGRERLRIERADRVVADDHGARAARQARIARRRRVEAGADLDRVAALAEPHVDDGGGAGVHGLASAETPRTTSSTMRPNGSPSVSITRWAT